MSKHEHIIVSGTGLITSLGLSREENWENICAGKSGIRHLTAIEQQPEPNKGGGQAPDLPDDFEPELKREVRYLKYAARAALKEAGISDGLPYDGKRCAIILGTTLHGMRSAGQYFRDHQLDSLDGFLAPTVIDNALGDLGINGMTITTCAACSSGLSSIGLAKDLLLNGDYDLVIAGGYDVMSEYAYAGFNSLRLIAPNHMTPFCSGREGMKIGEGYGVIILERASDAVERGAKPQATVCGFAETADAFHLTQPHPEGDGASRAIALAMEDAGVSKDAIDMVSAHATGTPDNDNSEYLALYGAFGDRLPEIPVIAFKSYTGHTLGGAGAVEMILAMNAMRDNVVPSTANVADREVQYEHIRIGKGEARKSEVNHTINLSIGFGGANTCVILGPPPAEVNSPAVHTSSKTDNSDRDAVITGVGSAFTDMIGNEAFAECLNQGENRCIDKDLGGITDAQLSGWINARKSRRLSEYVKITLASSAVAWADAGIGEGDDFGRTCYGLLGTTQGAAAYSIEFYQEVVDNGINGANPLLFAEGVPNCGAAHISHTHQLKRGCQTFIGARTAGIEALQVATSRIRSGKWDRVLVSAADEYNELVCNAYGKCGLHAQGKAPSIAFGDSTGFICNSGAVTLVLESRQSAMARGARIHAKVDHVTTSCASPKSPKEIVRNLRGMLPEAEMESCLYTSANGTTLDCYELSLLEAYAGKAPVNVTGIYGYVGECFSALPLGNIAAHVLSDKLPRFLGNGESLKGSLRAVSDMDKPKQAVFIATDFQGPTGAAQITLEN